MDITRVYVCDIAFISKKNFSGKFYEVKCTG